jgi:hypothetical protein
MCQGESQGKARRKPGNRVVGVFLPQVWVGGSEQGNSEWIPQDSLALITDTEIRVWTWPPESTSNGALNTWSTASRRIGQV